jgi:hypothetical protein
MHILKLNESLHDVKRFLMLFIENILHAITMKLLLNQKLKQQTISDENIRFKYQQSNKQKQD